MLHLHSILKPSVLMYYWNNLVPASGKQNYLIMGLLINLKFWITSVHFQTPQSTQPLRPEPLPHFHQLWISSVLMVELATSYFPSFVSHKKEAQIQNVKWPRVKDIIISCTSVDPSARPLIMTGKLLKKHDYTTVLVILTAIFSLV